MQPKRILTITELNSYIKGVFDDELILHNVGIIGEIEEFKPSGSSTYFTLKDKECRLSCLLFNRHEQIAVGTKVQVFGGVTFYKKTAKVSLIVKDIKLIGKADCHIDFLKLKEQLEKEGLFRDKKQMPVLAKTVALITSETGAVIEDFKKVLLDSGANIDIKLLPVLVQGEGAEQDILKAIDLASSKNFCDIVVMMRGGGSAGDLSIFNSEKLARAISLLKVFSITAIGHETDTTLVDLVADLRCSTPSIAANVIATNYFNTKNKVLVLSQSLARGMDALYNRLYARFSLASVRLERLANQKVALAEQSASHFAYRMIASTALKHSSTLLDVAQQAKNLMQSIDLLIAAKQHDANFLAIKLDGLSPLKKFDSGFAKLEKNEVPIASVLDLKKGDSIKLTLKDGVANATIDDSRTTIDTLITKRYRSKLCNSKKN